MSRRFGLLTRADRLELKEFHNLLFKNTDASLEWFTWYIDLIGAMGTRVYSVKDSDTLIGTWCVEPKQLRVAPGRVVNVGRCFAVGIHPDYRRQNLFVDLSKFAIHQEQTAFREYDYILGFPQVGRPVIDAHLKSGWEPVQEIEMQSWKPVRTQAQPALFAQLNDIQDFSTLDTPHDYVGCFVENGTYRNVRWLGHPESRYITLAHGGGHIVLKPYGANCHVLDLAGNATEVQILLEMAKTLTYRHRWNELTIWNAVNERHRKVIEACGFVPGATCGTSVVLLAVKINALQPLVLGETHFQMGSEEIY